MYRFKRCIHRDSLKPIFTAIVNSVIEYALPVYGQDNLNFDNLERKIARFLSCYSASNNPHTDLHIATATQLHKYHTNCLTKSIVNNAMLKDSVQKLFVIKERERASKFAHDFMVPAFEHSMYKNSFHYRAIESWNKLPSSLKANTTQHVFKRELQHILGIL